MKVLLIDPPGWQKHSWSLGLAYLAASLARAGFEAQILDLNNHAYSEERIKQIIADYRPQVIGVSVKTATANASVQIINRLKDIFPQVIYVAGGPHVTLCAKEFLQENPKIDLGLMGEGEDSFVKLIKSIEDGRQGLAQISGICYRQDGQVLVRNVETVPDISKLAYPAFDRIREMNFADFRYPLLTSRGCPHGCIFCCAGLISGKKWRARAPEEILGELLHAKDKYQIQSFEIMDDNFTLDVNRAKKFCRLLIKQRLNLDWWCHNGLRADRLDQELLFLMKHAGCQSIALGIESGDRDVFNNINKGEELSDIVRAVRMIKKAKMKCVGYFIIGLPGDSLESTKKSVRFQRDLELSDYKYNMLIPYPGTKIWENVEKNGRLLEDIKGTYHFGEHLKIPFETDKLSRQTLEECMHLAENQEWLRIEKDLASIKEDFALRFNRPAQKIMFIGQRANPATRNIEIACKEAQVLKIKLAVPAGEIKNKYLLASDNQGSYFNALFGLMQEGREIILDQSTGRLFMQKENVQENEYVQGELLPKPDEWDRSAKKYVATRLKKHSPDACSAKNGIIYKDNIALPFSHSPQFEKIPCGKIESGLAFISNSAFSPQSIYTADYLAVKEGHEFDELIISNSQLPAAEIITREADILFCPQELRYYPAAFYQAKISVGYSNCGNGIELSPGLTPDDPSRGIKSYFAANKKRVAELKSKTGIFLSRPFVLAQKAGRVLRLWWQIFFLEARSGIKNSISGR